MISLIRYNLKIVAPTLLWTGILVALMVSGVLFVFLRSPKSFDAEAAAALAEQMTPVIAAFFVAGVLDWEMKRGAHELLRSKRRPLWQTVAYRLGVALGISLAVGWLALLVLHLAQPRAPIAMPMLASIPSALVLALIALWVRVRLGNAFIGYTVALAGWLAGYFIEDRLTRIFGFQINPLLTLTAYTDRMHAAAGGALETTAFVDWWWVNKLALLVVSACIFVAVSRRVENLVEGD